MWVYKVGKLEVGRPSDLVRTAVAAPLIVGSGVIGAPLLRHIPQVGRLWAGATRRLLQLEESVRGLERVEPDSVYLVAPLHEGFADALVLAHLPLSLRFVARDELFSWPLLGRAFRSSGQIRVDPESRITGFRQLLVDTGEVLARGHSVVVFPQGSILGIEAAFQRGAFHIADRLGVSLLPVVITGTHRVWEHPYSDRLRYGQSVEMTVLDPIPVGDALSSLPMVEREMKRVALEDHRCPPRHFDPDRDSYWDDYAYEIDPTFREVAEKVARHRDSR